MGSFFLLILPDFSGKSMFGQIIRFPVLQQAEISKFVAWIILK